MFVKNILLEILQYYEKKLNEDTCTMEEIESITKVLEENMVVYGRLDDFAEHYGKSKDAVSGIIKRKMIQKPRRNVVLYPFHAFRKLVPESWRKKPVSE